MRLALRLVAVVLVVAIAYVGLTFLQVWQASLRDGARPAQAVIVLGAAQYDGRPSPVLRARLDHAIDLVEQGYAPMIVVTGGGRPGDRFTEATAAARYLHERGVAETALRREVHGRNTWEQLAATARFLRAEELEDVLLVSHPYHAFRITAIAHEVGVTAAVSPAKAGRPPMADNARALARETLAVSAGRLIGYRRLTYLILEPLG